MVLFISDLHLCATRPQIHRVFLDFLRGPARAAESLFVLGDLFEYWIGDDDLDEPFNASVVAGLAECSRSGPKLYIMHGNRDFLLDGDFARVCNARLVEDPHTVDLFGTKTLLMHGDTLCTDDLDYQRFRSEVRTPEWKTKTLSTSLALRRGQADALRRTSEFAKKGKAPEIMDVSVGAVETALRAHGYPRLIHGHTHRPARHEHRVDGTTCERWVLADWYRSGSYLRCDARGCAAVPLP